MRDLKLRWTYVRCHRQLFLSSTTTFMHSTYVVFSIIFKILLYVSGNLKTRMLVDSYSSNATFYVITENHFSINWPTISRLHFIPSRNISSSMISYFSSFLLITMFPIPSSYRVLLYSNLTLLFLVLSNLTNQFLWHVIWFEQPVSRYHDLALTWSLGTVVINTTLSSFESSWNILYSSSPLS